MSISYGLAYKVLSLDSVYKYSRIIVIVSLFTKICQNHFIYDYLGLFMIFLKYLICAYLGKLRLLFDINEDKRP